jgi:probable rRNA maturation factor
MNFPKLPDELPESPVSFYFEDVTFDLPQEAQVAEWLQSIAEVEQKALIEVNFIFCSDEHLRAINVEYLDHDYYTDVITFPYSDDAVHGDVFISAERVRDNAATLGVPFEAELCRVMAHGLLHLAGYDDKTHEKKLEMTAKEDFFLRSCPLISATS